MMMIDNIVAIAGTKNDWNYVLAEKLSAFLGLFLTPAFPFCADLAHTHGDLGWVKV
jgi:hypothetical protein